MSRESKWNFGQFFKPKPKPIVFVLNHLPVAKERRGQVSVQGEKDRLVKGGLRGDGCRSVREVVAPHPGARQALQDHG